MKIICIGRNYVDHAKELNNPIPTNPVVFMKPSSALLLKNKPFYIPEFSEEIHHEVELVIKIGKNGRHVQPEFAKDYYKEIALGIDFTARDVQKRLKEKGHPWEISKSFDHSAVLSEFIPVERVNRSAIPFHLTKNGEVVQKGNTKDMIFSMEEIITYVSKFFKLQMGDYIFTGTPAGVGSVAIGDRLEGHLETKTETLKMFSFDVR